MCVGAGIYVGAGTYVGSGGSQVGSQKHRTRSQPNIQCLACIYVIPPLPPLTTFLPYLLPPGPTNFASLTSMDSVPGRPASC